MRLTIDSLEPTEDDLLTVLGNLRYRLEGRLTRQGITLDWQVNDLPKLPSLTPHNVLHILRILQEAFTNIAKHARAKASSRCEPRSPSSTSSSASPTMAAASRRGGREGRGFASMRRRAQALGAKLAITPSPPGTTLSLYLSRSS